MDLASVFGLFIALAAFGIFWMNKNRKKEIVTEEKA
jgi:hypothetical protein